MLKRTADRKTANSVTDGGSVRIKNAFSLPSVVSCPGATEFCKNICYAGKLENRYPAFKSLTEHNLDILKGDDYNEMVLHLGVMMNAFIVDCEKAGAEKIFRWHADGDIFSANYAMAIAKVTEMFPEVHSWIYTRSFEFVPHITGYDNLSVYLSVDPHNEQAAKECYRDNPGVRLAYLSDTFDSTFIKDETDRPGAICPENANRIPLITNGEVGACAACRLCVFGKCDVRFKIHR